MIENRVSELAEERAWDLILTAMLGAEGEPSWVQAQRLKKLKDLKEGRYDLHSITVALRKGKTMRASVKDAFRNLKEIEASHLHGATEAQTSADELIRYVEDHGVVFIDEIDKLLAGDEWISSSPSVSRLGVQRDLLPLLEGTAIKTTLGTVRTDNILFITAGAFSQGRVEDLMPELLGRLPIRVILAPITRD